MGLGGRSLSGEEAFGDPCLGGKGGFHGGAGHTEGARGVHVE